MILSYKRKGYWKDKNYCIYKFIPETKSFQVLTISAWHILALSLSNLVLPGADSPLDELRHKVQYLEHAESVQKVVEIIPNL